MYIQKKTRTAFPMLRTRRFEASILLLILAGSPTVSSAQVNIAYRPDRSYVEIDGKPFTDLYVGKDVAKPFLYPLRAVSGTSVTRGFPLEEVAGDSKDHPHHRGLTFAHADLNGYNYWANESF